MTLYKTFSASHFMYNKNSKYYTLDENACVCLK